MLGKEYINNLENQYQYLVDLSDYRNPIIFFGVETHEGWKSIIDDIFSKLIVLDPDKKTRVVQIKEKFGTLRFYVIHSNKKIDELIRDNETKSSSICEICGEPGRLDTIDGWHRTRCEKHWKEK